MIHATTGAMAIMATIWVFVETLNASMLNRVRLVWGSMIAAVLMAVTYVAGGYWYVTYYAADKAVILAGPWPMAHKLVMEFKEHMFFATLFLSLILPIIIRGNNLVTNRGARMLVYVIAALVILTAFAWEGAGAFISMAVRLGLMK